MFKSTITYFQRSSPAHSSAGGALVRPMGMMKLPLEILLEILWIMDRDALARLSSTSRALHWLTLRPLYEVIFFESKETLALFYAAFLVADVPLFSMEKERGASKIRRRIKALNPAFYRRRRMILSHTRHISLWNTMSTSYRTGRQGIEALICAFPNIVSAQLQPHHFSTWGTARRVPRLFIDMCAYRYYVSNPSKSHQTISHLYIACDFLERWSPRWQRSLGAVAPAMLPHLKWLVLDMVYLSSVVQVDTLKSFVRHFLLSDGCPKLERVVVIIPISSPDVDYRTTHEYAALRGLKDPRVFALGAERIACNTHTSKVNIPYTLRPHHQWQRCAMGDDGMWSAGTRVA